MKKPIYLDYMATTPMDPGAIAAMKECLDCEGCFGNPASNSHPYGWQAADLVDKARSQIAQLINAQAKEIIFTSGATESDNLAIKGAAEFYQRQGRHIITMSTEHKAVLDTCKHLMTQGYDVTFLDPEPTGLLSLDVLRAAIRPDTILASIMYVNNETGVIQNIKAIGELLAEHGILFHVDAAQAAGKIAIDMTDLPVSLMSFSGHKVYGPKGIGALYVRSKPRVRLAPQMHGGGHELGMRSGTLATQQIVAMGEAFAIAGNKLSAEHERLTQFKTQCWQALDALGGVHLHGAFEHTVPNCLNITIDGADGEALLLALRDLAISTGSACNSANPEPSHVLSAMGVDRDPANRAIRMSFGRFTTPDDIDAVIATIERQVGRLRDMSPLWQAALRKKALQQNAGA